MPSLVRLHAHPQTDSTPEIAVEVAIARAAGELSLRYEIRGNVSALLVPVSAGSRRRDGLWQHTCAELFIAVPHQEAYCEFNFSPSTEWAAYEFSAYRHQGVRMTAFDSPTIVCRQREDELLLQVDIAVPALAQSERWQLGLSMVIEDAQGDLSYWALLHAGERPDFHHRDSFVLDI